MCTREIGTKEKRHRNGNRELVDKSRHPKSQLMSERRKVAGTEHLCCLELHFEVKHGQVHEHRLGEFGW